MEEKSGDSFERENGENNKEIPQWYVVYTVPRSEKKVNDRFEDEGIESYLPTYRTIRQWSDRKKSVEVPLFNSYVFVRVVENDLFKVLKIPGVVKLVYYLTKPAIVRQKEIDSIKEFLRQTEGYSYTIKKGDKVEISSGLLQGVYGEVIRIGKTKIIIQIEQLGASLVATVPRGQLKKPAFSQK
jgi:transcription antitermination factor NusG